MPNGIDLILADHRLVESVFEAFDTSQDGGSIGQVIDLLTAHDDVEQGALYPFALDVLGGDAVLDRSLVAHSAVKQQIDHLKFLEGAPLVESFAVLRRLVEDHVQDEEQHLLPALAEKASDAQLDTLGARILQVKQRGG
jgi:DNA-binding helix-hairpin-helix protein with protein kinase domain